MKLGVITHEKSQIMQQNPPEVTTSESTPFYFAVSKPKLVVMSLCTFGIYEIFWFYKNWELIKNRTGQHISPFWRAIFGPFFCYWLFGSVHESANSHSVRSNIRPGWFAIGYVALAGVSWRLPDPFWLIAFLSFLPLLLVQGVVSTINAKVAPVAELNEKFSWKNIIAIIVGGILLILTVLGTLVPEESSWEEYASTEGRFSVLLPGNPSEKVETMNTAAGPIDLHLFSVHGNDFEYSLAYNDYPDSLIQDVGPDAMLDRVRDGFVAGVKGKLLSELIISLDEYPGRELKIEITGGTGTVRSRIFMVRHRLYQVMVGMPTEKAFLENVDKFLVSFRLLED